MASTTRVLPGAGGPKEQQVPDGAPGRVQARQKHLVDLGNLLNGGVLADNFAAEGVFKLPGIIAAASRVEHGIEDGFHKGLAPLLWPVSWFLGECLQFVCS